MSRDRARRRASAHTSPTPQTGTLPSAIPVLVGLWEVSRGESALTPNGVFVAGADGFEIAVAGEVELAIFDTAGRRVRTLLSGVRGVGSTEIVWDGTDDGGRLVASGTYVARLRTLDGTRSQKLTLVR